MPRNMSFAMTTEQFKTRIKTVTRRFGWWFLKPGDVVCGVEKAMGLKKGEKIKKLGIICIVSTRKEPLNSITKEDCIKEGFPEMKPHEFVEMLCHHYKCHQDEPVNRIEFEHLYKPSSGTEFEWFVGEWCERCLYHPVNPLAKKQCKHLGRSFTHKINTKWIYKIDDPVCKAFNSRKESYKNRKSKQNKNQMQLFS